MVSAETIDFASLPKGSRLDVETGSRHYLIECVNGSSVKISGHPQLCPEPVSAWLQGSFDAEGVFEPGMLGRGRRLMFLIDRQPVTTSRIVKVQLDEVRRPETAPSSTIH